MPSDISYNADLICLAPGNNDMAQTSVRYDTSWIVYACVGGSGDVNILSTVEMGIAN